MNMISAWHKINDEDLKYVDDWAVIDMIHDISRSERDEMLIDYRYRMGMTLKQVAEKMEVTTERVRQIETILIQKALHPSIWKQILPHEEIRNKYHWK